ncbi:MAG: OmpA family protein [Brevinematales bacterium]|nr:OmpA family protein [Brevinematales bacterium]
MTDEGRAKKCPAPANSTPAWMTTFGDMNSLLLTFFIAMLTTAEIDGRELRLILSAFEGTFGMMDGGMTLSQGDLAEMGQNIENLPSPDVGSQLSKAIKQIAEILEPELKSKKVRLEKVVNGYKITLVGDIYFKPGSAEIDYKEGEKILMQLGAALTKIPPTGFNIEVVGHTDNKAVSPDASIPSLYASAWELSTARACTVVKIFQAAGVNPSLVTALGRGEQDPLMPNDTPEGRAYNRRVDIYITEE